MRLSYRVIGPSHTVAKCKPCKESRQEPPFYGVVLHDLCENDLATSLATRPISATEVADLLYVTLTRHGYLPNYTFYVH